MTDKDAIEEVAIEENYLWVEKYRPKKLSDLVISDDWNRIFSKWIKEKDLPHCLFYGPPGSGKSTLARILVNLIPDSRHDVLVLNGSSTTGVDAIRGLCEDFAQAPGISDSPKIIYIDEADYLSSHAQAALRNTTETFHENVRFILTGNYYHKFMDAIISRFQTFEFKKLPMDYVKGYVKNILTNEKIKFEEKDADRIIGMYYPDIRKIINTFQSRVFDGNLAGDLKSIDVQEKKVRSYVNDIISFVGEGKQANVNSIIQTIIKILGKVELDYSTLYEEIFFDVSLPVWVKPIVNDHYNKQENNCASSSMNFMACIFSIIKIGTQLRKSNIKM